MTAALGDMAAPHKNPLRLTGRVLVIMLLDKIIYLQGQEEYADQ
jgi:hypothetical protein